MDISEFTETTIAVTFTRSDVMTLKEIMDAGMDRSGIIYHILDELDTETSLELLPDAGGLG